MIVICHRATQEREQLEDQLESLEDLAITEEECRELTESLTIPVPAAT